jgi:hypothetical protein
MLLKISQLIKNKGDPAGKKEGADFMAKDCPGTGMEEDKLGNRIAEERQGTDR